MTGAIDHGVTARIRASLRQKHLKNRAGGTQWRETKGNSRGCAVGRASDVIRGVDAGRADGGRACRVAVGPPLVSPGTGTVAAGQTRAAPGDGQRVGGRGVRDIVKRPVRGLAGRVRDGAAQACHRGAVISDRAGRCPPKGAVSLKQDEQNITAPGGGAEIEGGNGDTEAGQGR